MAKILDIKCRQDGPRYKVFYYLENTKIAEYCMASYLLAVRQELPAADLSVNEKVLCLDMQNTCGSLQLAKRLETSIRNTVL